MGTVTMSAIWDRTGEVLRGRGGMLAGIAALLLFLPAAVQNGLAVYAGRTPGAAALVGLVGLAAAVLTIWGNLALIAAASDPRADRAAALRIGAGRLPLMIGVSLLVVLALVVLTLPVLGIVGARVASMQALSTGGAAAMVAPSHGAMVALLTYVMVLAAFGVWITARLALLAPVIVNERLGLRSFARSFELTRDLTWRIIGVLVLFGVVVLVANAAARAVVGIVARLLLGASGLPTATLLSALAGGAVVAGATAVSAAFTAQLYRATSGREPARPFE